MSVEALGPWQEITVADAIVAKRGRETRKLKTPDYQAVGALPIVDQGSELICGYTDDLGAAYPYDLPVIVFGDHTRALKFIDFPFAIGADGTQCLHPNEGFDPRFFYYALSSLDLRSEGYARHFKLLKERRIPVPPRDEQRRIAEVLWRVDRGIAAAQAVTQQADVLWQAMTEALIWNLAETCGECMRPLGTALLGSDYGVNVPLTLEEVGHPVLRMGNIQSGRLDMTDMKWGEVPAREAADLALTEGDILFNRTNSRDLVGKVALVREPTECLYASYIVRLSVDRTIADPYYLFAAMHSDRAQGSFRAIATPGVSQSNINPTNLKKQIVPLPALSAQRTIADQLRSVEEASFAAKQELAALHLIKRDLAADLLSGRVRVAA